MEEALEDALSSLLEVGVLRAIVRRELIRKEMYADLEFFDMVGDATRSRILSQIIPIYDGTSDSIMVKAKTGYERKIVHVIAGKFLSTK